MSAREIIALLAMGCAWMSVPTLRGASMGTAFTYQGQLKQGGSPVDGVVDLRFWLYDGPDPRLGTLVAGALSVTNVAVVNGLFSVKIDFGAAAFTGDRWLEIALASPAGSGFFTLLTPRQALTPTPFAIQTRGILVGDAGDVGIGTTDLDGRLHLTLGPDWTNNGWRKSLTLDAGAAIELGRGNTTKFGLGVGGEALYFFRTTTDRGAGSGPANYILTADATGRVGLGTTAPAERLDLGGGNIAMGYEVVWITRYNNHPEGNRDYSAMCPTGKRVIGGGCDGYGWEPLGSFPFDDPNTPEYDATGWRCRFSGDPITTSAYAICANIR